MEPGGKEEPVGKSPQAYICTKTKDQALWEMLSLRDSPQDAYQEYNFPSVKNEVRVGEGPNNVSTTLVTSRAHGCKCGSVGSQAAMASLAIGKRITIHLEGEMATRVNYEDYHGFEDCNVRFCS